MEDSLKILEEFIKYFEAEAVSRKYRRNISITVGEDDIEAIENLIKGYRELEEFVGAIKELQKTKTPIVELVHEMNKFEDEFIPKSKIKEILDRLHISDIEPWTTYKINGEILFDLEKLLGDE